MANVKITDLVAYTNPDSTDVLPIVDVGADVTKKVSIENLLKNASSGTDAAPGIAFDGDSNTGIYRPGADQLALSTNGTQALYINADGDILVADGNRMEIDEIRARDGDGLKLYDDAGNGIFVKDGGSVGIGTTSPGVALHVDGDIRADGIYGETDTNTSIQFPGSDVITFNEGGSEAARIDSSGRLLVGTTSSSTGSSAQYAILQAQGSTNNSTGGGIFSINLGNSGNTLVSGGYVGGLYYASTGGEFASIEARADGTCGSGDYPGRLVFYTTPSGSASPTERLRIANDGALFSVPVYNSTTGAAANVSIGSNGHFQRSTSSAKYKTDIEPLENKYADALLQCRPVWYHSTCPGDNPLWSYWGFIAEEVAAIDPRLVHWKTVEVTYDENGSVVETPCDPEPEGVQYDRFVPHLLNLIKRQKEQIESQGASIAALEARLFALESA